MIPSASELLYGLPPFHLGRCSPSRIGQSSASLIRELRKIPPTEDPAIVFTNGMHDGHAFEPLTLPPRLCTSVNINAVAILPLLRRIECFQIWHGGICPTAVLALHNRSECCPVYSIFAYL